MFLRVPASLPRSEKLQPLVKAGELAVLSANFHLGPMDNLTAAGFPMIGPGPLCSAAL